MPIMAYDTFSCRYSNVATLPLRLGHFAFLGSFDGCFSYVNKHHSPFSLGNLTPFG